MRRLRWRWRRHKTIWIVADAGPFLAAVERGFRDAHKARND